MRIEGWGLYLISFYTRIKIPHHLSHGLGVEKEHKQAGEGLCGGTVCGKCTPPPHPANPCKHATPRFFWGDTTYHLYTLVSITPSHFTAHLQRRCCKFLPTTL